MWYPDCSGSSASGMRSLLIPSAPLSLKVLSDALPSLDAKLRRGCWGLDPGGRVCGLEIWVQGVGVRSVYRVLGFIAC